MDTLRGGKIADPVHSYVDFTGIERAIIDHPLCQRLQYVSQNGLLHLVYPSVRTSRFSHSLGTMHLASRALTAALRNADDKTRKEISDLIKDAIVKSSGRVKDLERAGSALSSQGLFAWNHAPPTQKSSLLIAEQALRLAALFHDLGHLPFSHDFEYGLEEFLRSKTPDERQKLGLQDLLPQEQGRIEIHERLGHRLSELIFNDVFHNQGDDASAMEAARLSYGFAQAILDAPETAPVKSEELAPHWLHSLIAGEIDVDRCDYILRDGRNLGFDFVNFDLARLLDNLVLAKDGSTFVTAVKPQGLNAVESFLLARLLTYRYAIFHHKVAQVGVALRRSISSVLQALSQRGRTEEGGMFLGDLGSIFGDDPHPDVLQRFQRYDDMWWMGVMRGYCHTQPDEWLKLTCWRTRGPKSLWKRIEELPCEDVRSWNERLVAMLEDKEPTVTLRWASSVAALRARGIIVEAYKFAPWRKRKPENKHSVLCVQLRDGTLKPISQVSPLVASLWDVWMNDVQVRAFAESHVNVSSRDVFDELTKALSPGD